MKIKKKTLQVKVFMIHLLQHFKILPNVWYKCELDLAEMRAEELMKAFGWEQPEEATMCKTCKRHKGKGGKGK